MSDVDWSKLEQFPVDTTVHCNCGAEYRSRAKGTYTDGHAVLRSQERCPACGKDDDIRKIASDPEMYSL
jgi:hypothetical protein